MSIERRILFDGTPYLGGTTEEGFVMMSLTGPEENICKASLLLGIPKDNQVIVERNAMLGLLFLATVIPEWQKQDRNQWFNNAIKKVASGAKEAAGIVGNKKVVVKKSILGLSITITHK